MKLKRISCPEQLRQYARRLAAAQRRFRKIIVVSSGTCGRARGSAELARGLRKALKRHQLTHRIGLRVSGCIGYCESEPNLLILPDGLFYQKLKPQDAEEIVRETIIADRVLDKFLYTDAGTGKGAFKLSAVPFYARQMRLISGANQLLDPESIEDYIANGGYQALAQVLTRMSPEQVVAEVKKSGLRGRGGAGFPTGLKWETCRRQPGDTKYVICNADEGDPGAYMDRSLLEGNPHAIIEGMLIGAYAIGAGQGYIYVRTEYPLAVRNVGIALKQARALGLLGKNILGTDFNFDIQVARGAGAFVCGEETALIASIEGKPGIPTQRPPYPAQSGLYGKPTNINNVETWATVPTIIQMGGAKFSRIGTETSKGTKIFSLVGKVKNTGLVEVPMGTSLKELVYDIGGGITNDGRLKAVQIGGPSGGCIPRELTHLPIDYESLKDAGAMMGSGGVIVMDENTCMVDVAKYFMNFLREESCGKCTSCREGTQRMWEILDRITRGKGTMADIEFLEELATVVKDASMCGLGQSSANPILTTLKYFRSEYEAHVRQKRCPASVCAQIVSSPCQHACPISTEAPQYIGAIARGEFGRAYELIVKDNPLLTVCARVCHHPCEQKCRAGQGGEPIAIRELKRFAADYGQGRRPFVQRAAPSGPQVAVIGSGPAGLMAAWELVKKGYRVTIFEAQPVAGGMLSLAIPEFRLPRRELMRDIERIISAGVNIEVGKRLGSDFSLDDLFRSDYKAVFIAVGAHQSQKLGIPNENATGVLPAMEFLRQFHLTGSVPVGRRVGIVGGGNSAIDAARVAVRLPGVEQVTLLYRRTRAEMPAYPEEIADAITEGVDIRYLIAPKRVLTSNGRVTGVLCTRFQLGEVDQDGRRAPVPIPGSEVRIPLDTLIPAIGEQVAVDTLLGEQLTVGKRPVLVTDPETLATNRPGIFAGGDVIRGPSTVIQAMGDGKRAAAMIDKYLRGEPVRVDYQLTRPSVYVEPVELAEGETVEVKRQLPLRLAAEQRRKNFREVDLGLDDLSAVREARRCLRCDLETRKEDEKELAKHEAV